MSPACDRVGGCLTLRLLCHRFWLQMTSPASMCSVSGPHHQGQRHLDMPKPKLATYKSPVMAGNPVSERGGSPQPRSDLHRFIKTCADVHSHSQSVAASGKQTEKVMMRLPRSAAAAEASDEQHKGCELIKHSARSWGRSGPPIRNHRRRFQETETSRFQSLS